MRKIVLAGRGSLLATVQNRIIQEKIEACGYEVSVITRVTRGDREGDKTVMGLGGGGPFVREVEQALLTGEADIAVHCAKDLPYELAEGLCAAGAPDAADPRDCLLLRRDLKESGKNSGEDESAEPLVIGTGSPRRVEQLRTLYPKAVCREIRGNITTRLRKLREGEYDGIVLAKAGLDRIGADVQDLDVRVFEPEEMVPAVGQGLLVCECREDDAEMRRLLERITPAENALRFRIERELFCGYRCDCRTAVGIYAQVRGLDVKLHVMFGNTGETGADS